MTPFLEAAYYLRQLDLANAELNKLAAERDLLVRKVRKLEADVLNDEAIIKRLRERLAQHEHRVDI